MTDMFRHNANEWWVGGCSHLRISTQNGVLTVVSNRDIDSYSEVCRDLLSPKL
jgi:hypothetical protein